jgi:hypothetical protein
MGSKDIRIQTGIAMITVRGSISPINRVKTLRIMVIVVSWAAYIYNFEITIKIGAILAPIKTKFTLFDKSRSPKVFQASQ